MHNDYACATLAMSRYTYMGVMGVCGREASYVGQNQLYSSYHTDFDTTNQQANDTKNHCTNSPGPMAPAAQGPAHQENPNSTPKLQSRILL